MKCDWCGAVLVVKTAPRCVFHAAREECHKSHTGDWCQADRFSNYNTGNVGLFDVNKALLLIKMRVNSLITW